MPHGSPSTRHDVSRVTVAELRAALAPYADPAGGWRCPCCSRRLRVIRGRLTGCSDAADLAALVRQAADAGKLDRSSAA